MLKYSNCSSSSLQAGQQGSKLGDGVEKGRGEVPPALPEEIKAV